MPCLLCPLPRLKGPQPQACVDLPGRSVPVHPQPPTPAHVRSATGYRLGHRESTGGRGCSLQGFAAFPATFVFISKPRNLSFLFCFTLFLFF